MIRFIATSLIATMIGSAAYITKLPPSGYPGGRDDALVVSHTHQDERPAATAQAPISNSGFRPGEIASYLPKSNKSKIDPIQEMINHCHEDGDDDTVRPAPVALEHDITRRNFNKLPGAGQIYYRCSNSGVKICWTGANILCAKPENNVPMAALREHCRADAEAPVVPMSVTGHGTTRHWRCRAGKPIEIASDPLDDRGFSALSWIVWKPEQIAEAGSGPTDTSSPSRALKAEVLALAGPDKVELRTIRGTCTRFVTAGRVLTAGCKPLVLNNHHENGRVSFLFASQGNVLSFVGHKSAIEYDGLMYTLILDQIIVNDGKQTRNLSAQGTCEYTLSKRGEKDTVGCNVRSEGQSYGANFTTDAVSGHPNSKRIVTQAEQEAYSKVFPSSMRGVWVSQPKDCRVYQRGGIAALKANSRTLWIEVAGDTMRGTDNGRFLRAKRGGIIEMSSPADIDVPQEVVLVGDAKIEVKIQGARASMIYEQCPSS